MHGESALSRRDFIRHVSLIGLGVALPSPFARRGRLQELAALLPYAKDASHEGLFWNKIRRFFRPSGTFINLENGYCSPQPMPTLHYHIRREKYINAWTSMYTREQMPEAMESVRTDLAAFLAVDPEELAITRNTTESLNTIIMGYPWNTGDEVVIGNQDYGSMVQAFQQAQQRYGIVVKEAAIPLHPSADDEIVESYMALCTAKTRMVHLTHLIHLSGHVIPVAKIAQRAHERGIEVVVDAAHSVAHLDYKIPDLAADYVGASLHKWLCCPLGCGFLWMKKEHIPKIWPLMGDTGTTATDIRRFEHQGTRPFHSIEAISRAIAFHTMIGGARKEARLKYLMTRWVSKIAALPKVRMNTPWDQAGRNSAIANFNVNGYAPADITAALFARHKIFTVAIDHPAIQGVRVAPHLYTTVKEVDALTDAIREL
ncbi:MAG: aminotransferase class V-fold PLP-dependent enzyme [bacterium]|nr:aminotransferase class V-fold PLP-dependent enzyme [bacterium]